MARIDDLRALAKKRQRAVNNKISRIRNVAGAEIKGTSFDPRKPIGDISKMNSRQLSSYIKRLDKFQSRSNQFVGLAENEPAPRSEWNKFVKSQGIVDAVSQEYRRPIDATPLPDQPTGKHAFINTIGTQRAIMNQERLMKGMANGVFRQGLPEPWEIRGRKALSILMSTAQKQSARGYLENRIKKNRETVGEALKKMGQFAEMQDEFDALTDYQFSILWERPGMMDQFFATYDLIKKMTADTLDKDDDLEEFGTTGKVARDGEATEPSGYFGWAGKQQPPKGSKVWTEEGEAKAQRRKPKSSGGLRNVNRRR